jgi:hypothetical protein
MHFALKFWHGSAHKTEEKRKRGINQAQLTSVFTVLRAEVWT